MDDNNADYQVVENIAARTLANTFKDRTVTGTAYVIFDDHTDSDLAVRIYVVVTSCSTVSGSTTPTTPDAVQAEKVTLPTGSAAAQKLVISTLDNGTYLPDAFDFAQLGGGFSFNQGDLMIFKFDGPDDFSAGQAATLTVKKSDGTIVGIATKTVATDQDLYIVEIVAGDETGWENTDIDSAFDMHDEVLDSGSYTWSVSYRGVTTSGSFTVG